jgi:DNA polymerase-4
MPGGFSQPRSVVHLNVVDFAASVERVIERRLAGRPLIVAHPGAPRARVLDMSEEAFQAGIRKRMPLERARKVCREAKVLPPRPDLYQRAMAALFRLGGRYSPLVESGRDDGHLYLDLTGTARLWGPAQDAAWRLRKEAMDSFRLDPIWSVATNKLVAKAASRIVKPDGELIVRPGEEESFLLPLSIHLLPGLERADLRLFRELNIAEVGQAAEWTPTQFQAVFGRRGLDLNRWVRGDRRQPGPAARR